MKTISVEMDEIIYGETEKILKNGKKSYNNL